MLRKPGRVRGKLPSTHVWSALRHNVRSLDSILRRIPQLGPNLRRASEVALERNSGDQWHNVGGTHLVRATSCGLGGS